MENNKWRIEVQGGGQIADTGDYSDPIYVLTNGDIELYTKQEIDDESYHTDELLNILNSMLDVKWEDWKLSDKEYELYLATLEINRLKQILQMLQVPENVIETLSFGIPDEQSIEWAKSEVQKYLNK